MSNQYDYTLMMECKKWDSCGAPLCPLDPIWFKRIHRSEDRTCLWIREWVRGVDLSDKGMDRNNNTRPDMVALINKVAPDLINHNTITKHKFAGAKTRKSKLGNRVPRPQK